MRAPVAVRLDIRPRLTLPAEPRAAVRPRFRLPPLALPAAGYWLAMGALTYAFTRLGPHPLDDTEVTAEQGRGASAEERQEPRAPSAELRDEQPSLTPIPSPEPEPEPEPAVQPATTTTPEAKRDHEREQDDQREAGRREGFLGSRREEREEREQPAPQVAMSFPDFTDSSRPARREHAGDGARIDSLFEKSTERPDAGPDAPPPPENDPEAPVVASSCVAAIARNNEQVTIGGPRGAPDISREAYASILQNGRYLSSCSIPDRTVFEICAAVKDGQAVGITVVSSPPAAQLNACVRSAVAHLKFPRNQRLDVTHTRFDAVSR
jgi:hypothetical protein